jgi:hypothetical protein
MAKFGPDGIGDGGEQIVEGTTAKTPMPAISDISLSS